MFCLQNAQSCNLTMVIYPTLMSHAGNLAILAPQMGFNCRTHLSRDWGIIFLWNFFVHAVSKYYSYENSCKLCFGLQTLLVVKLGRCYNIFWLLGCITFNIGWFGHCFAASSTSEWYKPIQRLQAKRKGSSSSYKKGRCLEISDY